jgi:transcriptional regulator with XRE-family HTH domain
MITNEREYRITRAQARDLERALAEEDRGFVPDGVHPTLAAAAREGLRGEVDELKRQLNEFDQLRSGRKRIWEVESLGKLPEVIIQARISAGMTQKLFADQLQVKEQQVQRYESSRYHGVSLERIEQAAVAAGLQFQIACWRVLPQEERVSSTWVQIAGTWQPNTNVLTHGASTTGFQLRPNPGSVVTDFAFVNSLKAGGNVVIDSSYLSSFTANENSAGVVAPLARGSVVPARERLGMDANRRDLEVAR